MLFFYKFHLESLFISLIYSNFGEILLLIKLMAHSFYIEPNEESLRILDEKFKPVVDDRFLYNVHQKKWSFDDIHNFNAKIKISYDYTSKEYDRIKTLKCSYNLNYPSDHKKYFSTAVELMSKIRCTLSAYKKIVKGFRPRNKRRRKHNQDLTNNNSTPLFCGPYSKDLFKWDSYTDNSVKEMLENLNNYLELAKSCLDECINIINEEKDIRANPEWAFVLYEDSFKRSVKNNIKLIDILDAHNINIEHDIVKAMEEAEDVKLLIASLFHEINTPDFNFFCACKTISDGRKEGLTNEESLIFGKDNAKKVFRLRLLLEHILELVEQRDDAIGWNGMLCGKFVMHLLFWCGWDGSKKEAMLKYITKGCQRKIKVVKMGAVMAEKRKLAHISNEEENKRQNAFNTQMDAFVDSIMQVSSTSSN